MKIKIFSLALVLSALVYSQNLPGKLGVGGDLGLTIFQGESKPGVQIIGDARVRYGVLKFLSVSGKFSGGWVAFKDKITSAANYATIISGELQAEYHFLPLKKTDLFFFLSAGMIHYQPNKSNFMGLNTPTVGFGLGLSMFFRHFVSLDFDVSYNLTTRGNFDGNSLTKNNDGFISLKVGVSYYFFDKLYLRKAYLMGKKAR